MIDKIIQYGKIRPAFQKINISRSGKINLPEFKYMIKFWGMEDASEEEIQKCYDLFDLDGDGIISFKDF